MLKLDLIAEARLPTPFAEFAVRAYLAGDGKEHLALTLGDFGNTDGPAPAAVNEEGAPDAGSAPGDVARTHAARHRGDIAPLVRVHSECLTGDALFSLRCDCGFQLRAALETIAREGRGALLYLRQEGRGIGLGNKIRAYALQDQGADTVEANHQLGFPTDGRDHGLAVALLRQLGLRRIRLMTNNPAKLDALVRDGVEVVERVPVDQGRNPHNAAYLDTKMAKMGHLFGGQGTA